MRTFLSGRNIVIPAVLATFSACAVGPDFKPPEAPAVNSFTAEALPQETASWPGVGGTAQRFIPAQQIPAQWWALYQSKALDEVVRLALANSPTLQAAQARLRQAYENLRARTGSALFPSIDAEITAERQKISGAVFGEPGGHFSPFTIYNASVQFSYALDFFGGARRELEALRAQLDFERFQLEGAHLTLASNVVTTAVKEASLRAQLQALREIASVQEKQLGVVEQQFRLGAVSLPDVLAQRAQLAQTVAGLPPLERDLTQTRNQLAALIGRLPAEAAALPLFDLRELRLPDELPVSLPSSLVRQRPDIRASEELLHAASAQIGVATADLYPQITLKGSYGTEAVKPGSLFSNGTNIWSLGAGLLQPLFRGGELRARRRASVAAYEQAEAQYRSTVLNAFQNVADVLNALEADARALKAQGEAEAAARESFELSQKQFQLGAVSYLALLNAERQYQQARISVVRAQAARFADTAALFQALGGGWWNREGQAENSKSEKSKAISREDAQKAQEKQGD